MRFDAIPRELLERCRAGATRDGSSGPDEAFDELCRLIQPDLYAFLYSLLRNHDDTDEALVECLVRIYRHLGKLQEIEKFPGWVMRLAVNQVQSHRSRAAARATVALDEAVEVPNESLAAHAQPPLSPRAVLEQREVRTEIDSAIAALPPRQRAAILMYEVEQLPVREIATALECSEGAVKFNLHEARKKLRELLAHLLQPSRKEPRA